MADPIKIFCGTEPKTYIAQRVLEHSIKTRTTEAVEFVPMIGPEWEYPIDGIKVGTGFSLRRWMIPGKCGFQGKAIYLDADQLVLGDIAKLWHMDQRPTMEGRAIYCTYQVDKFSPQQPVPQTSVMLIDCKRAVEDPRIDADGWDVEKILEKLRRKHDAVTYGIQMHGLWIPDELIGRVPVEWNHLNVHTADTKLLHYTKEPEQPWYKPDHPLAGLWETALRAAMADGYVTQDDIRDAIAKWNVKEDWRNTNGLHPYYKKYLRTAKAVVAKSTPQPKAKASSGEAKILWVTTFAQDMFEASGKQLIETFLANDVVGDMLAATEGMSTFGLAARSERVNHYDLSRDTFLSGWLAANADVIPKHLGGDNPGTCTCPGGPFDAHDKRHTMPCIGHWFNRNASRWFRKVAAQRVAVSLAEMHNYDTLIWVDADTRFKKRIKAADVDTFFKGSKNAAFYLRNKRPIMEAGILGFRMNLDGQNIIRDVVECYRTGDFRKMKRWDDSAVYQWFFDRASVPVVDIATGVGDHAAVVPHSPLNPFLAHDKGKHGRGLGIMK